MSALDGCFPAKVSNMCRSMGGGGGGVVDYRKSFLKDTKMSSKNGERVRRKERQERNAY